MQVVITIEGSQADVLEQEPDELVQFSTDGEYTCTDGCGVLDLLYVVDFDHACANRNQLKITVREQ